MQKKESREQTENLVCIDRLWLIVRRVVYVGVFIV